MSDSEGQPEDDVLLELGRLAWAAMQLEEVVYVICRCVKPRHGPYDDHPIGPRIDEALRDLSEFSDAVLQARTTEWLLEAKAALASRNSVLHARHIVFVPWPGTTPVESGTGSFLAHFSRKERAQTQTPLTSEGLRPLRRRLQAAAAGWADVATAVYDAREP